MPQVSESHYCFDNYEEPKRFLSYWHQLGEILRLLPSSVLEIGTGSGILRDYLQRGGIDVFVADFDERLGVDVVGDVRHLPICDSAVDVVAAFQVLEHLPFEDFKKVLSELRRVARKHVVISLPHGGSYLRVAMASSFIRDINLVIPLDWLYKRAHRFDGQHHWEINKRGFPLRRIRAEIRDVGLAIEREFRSPGNPYHYFLVMKR